MKTNHLPAKFKTALYVSWRAMKQRCLNPKNRGYSTYGGRGIRICEEWLDFSGFEAWAKANGHKDGLTLDRVDPNKNYEPCNCRWATAKEQSENRHNACFVTVDGVTLNVAEWSKLTGIFITTLYKRYHAGVRGKDFITKPRPLSKGSKL